MTLKSIKHEDFQQHLLNNRTVVVKFTAPWCGPCRASQPIFEKAAADFPDISFVEVNVDEQPRLAAQFNIRSIPTTMAWKDARMVWQAVGAPTAGSLTDELNKIK